LRKNFKTILTTLVALSLLILTFSIYSCCEDCPVGPVQPKPYNGWVYATDILNDYLFKIDTETDSVVDSLKCEKGENYMPGRVVCSDDGRYIAISFGNELIEQYLLRIYDAQTLTLISEVEEPINPLFFLENGSLLLTRVGKEFVYYSVPGLGVTDRDSMIYSHPNLFRLDMLGIDESQNLAYIIARFDREGAPLYSDSVCLYAYDYVNKEIDQEWVINIRDGNGDFYIVNEAALDVGRSHIYAICGSYADAATFVVGYDYRDDQILFENRIDGAAGDIELTPDEHEIYVVDPGQPGDIWTAGTLYVFDAHTGAYTHGISLYGFVPNRPDIPMYANVIEFTPTGDKAYIGSGLHDKWNGNVCSINTSTYAVENLAWPDFNHIILRLATGPK